MVLEADFSKTKVILAIFAAYGASTPIGVAIGVVIHQVIVDYSVRAEIIATGILESVGAGILLYDVLVNIVSPHFGVPRIEFKGEPEVNGDSNEISSGSVKKETESDGSVHSGGNFMNDTPMGKFIQILALYLGAAVMAIIGKWA
ncbi:hypothetical protein HK096_010108 [Nowakowskiella sp. JEL0078]|nr:hypothetical protein HK096_010108 [Nowakowskiella sp. JEL0078]